MRDDWDMVIGHRRGRQDGWSRRFVTYILKCMIKAIFGVEVLDANTPFRLIKATTLQKYIKKIPRDYHLANVLLSVIYAKYSLKVHYIPITFRPRQGGKNSINIKRIARIGWDAIKEFRKLAKEI